MATDQRKDTGDGRANTSDGVPFVSLATLRAQRQRCSVFVDLRSPSEFADDRVSAAINIPLFENETRSFVGLLYKQFSPDAAFNEARAAVIERIESLVREIATAAGVEPTETDLKARVLAMTSGGIARLESDLEPRSVPEVPEGAVVLSCARGGLRSRSVVALLRAVGFENAVGLSGGYRSFRRDTIDRLAAWEPPRTVIALRGLTGTGKTLLLQTLERMRPGLTLDLEGLAGHRSSLLGMVGLAQTSQKAFESGLSRRLRRGFPDGVMVIEGESRKVGDAVVPVAVWEALQGATNVHVTASMARRVQILRDDYMAVPSALPKLRVQLGAVAERMPIAGDRPAPDLQAMFDRGEIDDLVVQLLEHYYDPLYLRSEASKDYALEVEHTSEDVAAQKVLDFIDARPA